MRRESHTVSLAARNDDDAPRCSRAGSNAVGLVGGYALDGGL